MPTTVTAEELKETQKDDVELKTILKGNTSLKLQKVTIISDIQIYCDISSEMVRTYILQALRRKIFDSIHGLLHPSRKTTSTLVRQKYVWPNIKKTF